MFLSLLSGMCPNHVFYMEKTSLRYIVREKDERAIEKQAVFRIFQYRSIKKWLSVFDQANDDEKKTILVRIIEKTTDNNG